MLRRPVFWIALTVISVACALFSLRLFPDAFPIVNLDLRMDRETALAEARGLADRHGWGPEGYRQAASFDLDSGVQAFVELEGGGREAFSAMLQDGSYAAYRWRVRHFKEGETHEILIRFTPAGEPYGFRERIPEDDPGAALDADEARVIAETVATGEWDVDLSKYERAESSSEERPGGRVDHTFVYERPERIAGEARFRLRLGVSGDRLTDLTHFVKVPEAFTRRYEEMRSINQGIGQGGAIAMLLLYGIGGIGIALFLLLRKRAVIWKQALGWGLFVSFMATLVSMNHWPLAWMGYNTAISVANFTLQQVGIMAAQFLGMGVLLTLSFMAAEGLTRMAFPEQIQLWKLWSKGVAGSPTVLGLTVGGYLAVTIFMAFDVSLYFFAHRWLGWWTPSSAQVDPDVLATLFPWFDSIAISLQAGFWEECLFRALPIAGAALIGQRLGGRRYWIVGAFVVQALIFGAGHAAYPTQPAYARVVELIIPSVAFGLIYLRLGLLPAIVLHYAFDVVWISLPLFTSSAPGVGPQRALVILFAMVPLGIVLAGRLRAGAWSEVEPEARNAGWLPPDTVAEPPPVVPAARPGLGAGTRTAVLALGLAGAATWFLTASFTADVPPMRAGRSEAQAASRRALAERGLEPGGEWREMSTVFSGVGDDDRFVWTEGGPDEYAALAGAYLNPPRWWVRYGRFEGDVAERAEEFTVLVDGDGEVFRVRHSLPEAREGASLEEQDARLVALDTVNDTFGLDADEVEEVSADSSKLPERTDWTFRFRDREAYSLERGEARIGVEIAGDEITDTWRYVHVPEEWERAERNRETALQVLGVLSVIGLAGLLGAGAVGAVVRWSRRRFAVRACLTVSVIAFVLGLLGFLNQWPSAVANFSTAQSYTLQAAILIGFGLVGVGIFASVLGLNAGLVQSWLPPRPSSHGAPQIAAGLALGFAAAGLAAAAGSLMARQGPLTPDFAPASAWLPLVDASLGPVYSFVLRATVALVLLASVDRFTEGWTRRKGLFTVLLFVTGLILAGAGADSVTGWMVAGLATGAALWAAYVVVLRFDPTLTVLVAAGAGVPGVIQEGFLDGYPSALVGSILAAALIVVAAVLWMRGLDRAATE